MGDQVQDPISTVRRSVKGAKSSSRLNKKLRKLGARNAVLPEDCLQEGLQKTGTLRRLLVTSLLAWKADAAAPDDVFNSPEEMATLKMAIETIKSVDDAHLLINIGYTPFPNGQQTVLHWAAASGSKDMLESMWACANNNGIQDINVRDELSRTPLHHAVQSLDSGVFHFLFARGADPNAVDNEGLSALTLVIGSYAGNSDKCKSIAQMFINCRRFDLEQLSTSKRNGHPTTPLMEAAMADAEEIVEILIRAGANKGTLQPGTNKTALQLAIAMGCEQTPHALGGDGGPTVGDAMIAALNEENGD